MDLILWRHADAEDGHDDANRKLTAKGHRQAAAMAKWLRTHLPRHHAVIASPAVRTRETAAALADDFAVVDALGLAATPGSVLHAAGWPSATHAVVVVGHQPTMGMTAAQLVTGRSEPWSVRKGSIIWIARRGSENVLRAVLAPDML